MHIQDDSNDNAVRKMYDTSVNTKWNVINDAVDGVEAESESAESESAEKESAERECRERVSLRSSCSVQQDGYRWLKLLDCDEYPALARSAPAVLRRADGDRCERGPQCPRVLFPF